MTTPVHSRESRVGAADVASHRAGHPSGNAPLASRGCLASVSRAGGDGVAHVARLLHLALLDICDQPPRLVDLEPKRTTGVSTGERARFLARLATAQLSGDCEWALFNHVAIARPQQWLPSRLRRPYGVFVHGIEVWGAPLTAAAARTLRDAAVRISNSHFTARRLEAACPEVGGVVACPLALLPDSPVDRSDVDRELLARIRPASALIVGRLSLAERYKGHDQLIEDWPGVSAAVPGAQLVVVGTGDDELRLREKAAAVGAADDVLFCGRVSDSTLAELYSRTRVFAMPSRGEGFGIVYLEAMRAGRPCIAGADDGAQDVVVNGETGMLVRQHDRGAVRAAVVGLLSDTGKAAELGEAGRRRYQAFFTFQHFRDRLAVILGDAFGRREESAS